MSLHSFVFYILSIVAILFSNNMDAQQKGVDFRYPLDVQMSLSGNYGELRGNHFHSGIDFRVGGVSGAPVYATERGYVSKITVSPTGYGNALYITHPDGFVSVYGHLQKYAGELQEYVVERQYEKESFRIELEFSPEQFPVKKGDLVAYAGNTGSSGGPHLHFEIRSDKNIPLSLMERGYIAANDNLAPVLNRVDFYGYSNLYGAPHTFRVQRPKDAGATIDVPQYFYVAIDAIDKMEGTNAKLAVNEYKVYLDSELIYHLTIGEVPFEHSKYINSLIEYSRRHNERKSAIKTYVEPGNLLWNKIERRNDGIICLQDSLPHKVKVELLDYKKNRFVKSYTVKRNDSLYVDKVQARPVGTHMVWYMANVYQKEGFKISIPPASLYRNIYFMLDTAENRVTPFAPVWRVHTGEIPLHSSATLQLDYNGPDSLASKALIASCGAGGKLYGIGGRCENGVVKAKISTFGNYTVALDLDAPEVIPNFKNGAVLKGNSVSFVIRDGLSGIGDYRVEIDGHWVLARFDAKSARLTVTLPEARIKRGTNHKLEIKVTDNKGNKTLVKRNFKW
ncbi:MAG: M23 family metallopeptidase [Bacteroidales bacterium]|nr:M23 family metallopeptidase [Bacteroidales bacterium]